MVSRREYIRFHHANSALVKILDNLLTTQKVSKVPLDSFADVMPTGYHAARVATVQKGDKVVVIGDGAVGQRVVIAAKMRGASQIILMSRQKIVKDGSGVGCDSYCSWSEVKVKVLPRCVKFSVAERTQHLNVLVREASQNRR